MVVFDRHSVIAWLMVSAGCCLKLVVTVHVLFLTPRGGGVFVHPRQILQEMRHVSSCSWSWAYKLSCEHNNRR